MARQRIRKVEEKPIGSIVQILFDAPPNTFLSIFDADVRIECDRGKEKEIAEHIQNWVRQRLMSLIPAEEPAPPETPEPIVG